MERDDVRSDNDGRRAEGARGVGGKHGSLEESRGESGMTNERACADA